MLVLSRQRQQSIMIGPDIRVTVVDIQGNRVRLGFDAPESVEIFRTEIFEKRAAENPTSRDAPPE